jgi:glycosyltransferase involved in cell wall biosynthesis
MNAPRVSIVVPVYNGARTLDQCLRGCLAQTHPNIDVTVVDDGSTDATPTIAAAHHVQYIRQEQSGPAAARNLGARSTTGDYIAFTDADCVPDPNWIAELLKAFDEGVVAAGGTYGNENDASWLSRMIHEEIQVRHANLERDVDFLGSFNVMYCRDAFEAAGGFDESFRTASGEDNDLAYRLQDNGGRLAFTRAAIVSHHHPTGLVGYLRTQARHGYWRMKLYQKHPGRASGDRYAGLRDLAAAGLPVICLLHLAAVAVTANTPTIAIPLALGSVAYVPAFLVLHADLPLRMAVRTRDAAMSLFWFVMVLRDFARAAGLVAGAWRFRIMKRTA